MTKEIDKHENDREVNGNPITIWDKLIDNKKYVLTLVSIYVGFFLILERENFDFNQTYIQLATILFIPISVSLMIILIERVFEKRSIHSLVRRDLDLLRGDIKSDVESIFTSKYKFGFDGVDKTIDDETIVTDPLNTGVKWMNTKFSEHNNVEKVVKKALSNGCNVRLLMMHKENSCAEFRARDACSDHEDEDNIKIMVNGYINKLNTSYDQLLNFYKRMSVAKENDKSRGELQLRFYKDLPSIPIIVVSKEKKINEAWSGFYLTKFSSENPYTKWISKGDNFVDRLDSYFERKWYFSREYDASKLLDEND